MNNLAPYPKQKTMEEKIMEILESHLEKGRFLGYHNFENVTDEINNLFINRSRQLAKAKILLRQILDYGKTVILTDKIKNFLKEK